MNSDNYTWNDIQRPRGLRWLRPILTLLRVIGPCALINYMICVGLAILFLRAPPKTRDNLDTFYTTMYAMLNGLGVLVIFACVIYLLFAVWLFLAARNLRFISCRERPYLPWIVLACGIIPHLHIVLAPYYATVLYRGSHKADEAPPPIFFGTPGYILSRLILLYVTGGVLNYIAVFLIFSGHPALRANREATTLIAGGIFGIGISIMYFVILRMLTKITNRQSATYGQSGQLCPSCGEQLQVDLESCPVCGAKTATNPGT